MKIQLISDDKNLLREIAQSKNEVSDYIQIYSGAKNSLDILSSFVSTNASLIIIDDDYTSPHSVHLLESVRKVRKEQKIIFLTSDNSIGLGKDISSLGVQYYAIKPITGTELIDSIKSILKIETNLNY
jgi:DNA-binding NarL/FixJ family response regulator